MTKARPLSDETYRKELERLRHLPHYPEIPAARQQMIRAMREITSAAEFLHSVITHFVDHAETCPTVHELIERARIIRSGDSARPASLCPHCGGTGWRRGTKLVKVAGMEAYEAEYSARCACAAVHV